MSITKALAIYGVITAATLIASCTAHQPLTFTDYFKQCKGKEHDCTAYAFNMCTIYGCAK